MYVQENVGVQILKIVVIAAVLGVVIAPAAMAIAQQGREFIGAYDGEIGPQQATLHLRVRDGALTATLDHLDPAAPWMFTCSDVKIEGRSLTFKVASVDASWKGEFSADGQQLSGTWTQKNKSWMVVFAREKFVPAAKPSPVDGIWLGTAPVTAHDTTRIQLVVRSDADGREYCTMDVLDTYDMDLECANAALKGNVFSLDIPAGATHWQGTLAADGNSLSGNMTVVLLDNGARKNVDTPLNLTRQTALSAEKPRPGATYSAAMPPVSAETMESILRADLAGALRSGELAPSSGGGVTIGVYSRGVTRVFTFGAASPDSIYEIGSITRSFTGLALVQMAEQKRLTLDEPVRELLPPGTVARPAGEEITLRDLAGQRSGLPTMPDNISVASLDQPYADYHPADLYAYLARHGVANPARVTSSFASLGFGLLGVALADRAGEPYAQLIADEITVPLGMKDTVIALSPQQQARMIAAHDQFHQPSQEWQSDALAGAIGLRSTAGDVLTFLVANLHSEQLNLPAASTLPAAIRKSLEIQGELTEGMDLSLGWLYQRETGNYWRNGATAAHSAYCFFNPRGDFAAVVLYNTSPGVNGSFVEVLGRHVYQRLAGKPAISLGE